MSAIVNLQTTDQNAVKLARFLSEIAPNESAKAVADECVTLGEQSQFTAFVKKLISSPDLLFASENDRDIEGIFSWVTSLLVSQSDGETESLSMQLCNSVAAESSRSQLRLRILTSLFNLLSRFPVRCQVFTLLLNYAVKTGNVPSISSYLINIDVHVNTWSAVPSNEELQSLYLLTYQALASISETAGAQNSLLKYLAIFTNESLASAKDLDSVKEQAANAVIGTIEAPLEQSHRVDYSGILSYPAVQQLKDDGKYANMYNLLKVFSNGDVEQFKNSCVDGINFERGMENVRLLRICVLASSARELKYDDIAKALDVDIKDVEQWIVKAVTAELLVAQIDQLRSVIIVERAAPRFFNDQQWNDLNQKLHGWRDNVKELLSVVRSAKEQRAKLNVKRGAAKKA